MSVRKREWTTRKGEAKEAWIVDYTDQDGHRHIKTFRRKKDADAYADQAGVDVRAGIHTAESKSITVAQAAEDWIRSVALEGREASTLAQYRQHAHHINQRIGNVKLASLTTPRINKFRDDLLKTMSRVMARKVLSSLKSLLRHAQNRGNVAQNVALAVKIKADKRDKGKLEVGVDIPTTDEIKAIIDGCGSIAAAAAHCDLHRAAIVRAARAALVRRRSQAKRAPRAPARRPLRQDRQAEVEGWSPHRAARSASRQRAARVEARSARRASTAWCSRRRAVAALPVTTTSCGPLRRPCAPPG